MQYFCTLYVYKVMEHLSEEEIYEGCRRGDNQMRRALYDRYGGRLMAVAMRYTGERQVAEDLLHDVFVSVLTDFNRFSYRGEGSILAWLTRVMVNASLDYLRHYRRADDDVETLLEEETPADDASAGLIHNVPADEVMRMIAQLPQGYRTVFNLYTFEGKSHREIAQMLGINEKSSSSQLARAKQILIRRINEYFNS